MRKNKMIYALISILGIALIIIIMMLSNPLRRSVERIRDDMLKLTPIGTNMEDVIAIIESNEKWKINYISESGGYLLIHGLPYQHFINSTTGTMIGEKSIKASLGHYNILFHVYVTVYFGFDENSKLIDIAVSKNWDVI